MCYCILDHVVCACVRERVHVRVRVRVPICNVVILNLC